MADFVPKPSVFGLMLRFMGLAPSERDLKLRKLVSSSYESVRVVGRGTVMIDPKEIAESESFRQARAEARRIVCSAR